MNLVNFYFFGAMYRGAIKHTTIGNDGITCHDILVINDDGSEGAICMGVEDKDILK